MSWVDLTAIGADVLSLRYRYWGSNIWSVSAPNTMTFVGGYLVASNIDRRFEWAHAKVLLASPPAGYVAPSLIRIEGYGYVEDSHMSTTVYVGEYPIQSGEPSDFTSSFDLPLSTVEGYRDTEGLAQQVSTDNAICSMIAGYDTGLLNFRLKILAWIDPVMPFWRDHVMTKEVL